MAKSSWNGNVGKVVTALIVLALSGACTVLWAHHGRIATVERGDKEVMRRLEGIDTKLDKVTDLLLKG